MTRPHLHDVSFGIAAVAVFGLVIVVPHARADGSTVLVSISGTCTRLIEGGRNLTAGGCKNKALSFNLPNGRTGFMFEDGAGTEIFFNGNGYKQTKLYANKVSQPIDDVRLTNGGHSRMFHTQGRCVYGNPYIGRAVIACSATTDLGLISTTFVTDGSAPTSGSF